VARDTERIRVAVPQARYFDANGDGAESSPAIAWPGRGFSVVEGRRAATRVELAGLPPELASAGACAGGAR